MPPFRIGTRGSPLALAQARMVRDALIATPGRAAGEPEIVVVRTTGDRVQDRPLAEIGGKALWTRELDRALSEGAIDCAVHSMKDVETVRPATIALAAMLERADVRDRLIGAESVAALRPGAVIGTSSPRRAAQLRRLRPDCQPVNFRGNVETRLAKLAAGEVDATLLAAAGLRRLGQDQVGVALAVSTLLPAAAQGAVGIECRAEDHRVRDLLARIDHQPTRRCVLAERALLAALGADCHSPLAALAVIEQGRLWLRGELLTIDGSAWVAGEVWGAQGEGMQWENEGEAVARHLADDLLTRAPEAVRRLFGGGG